MPGKKEAALAAVDTMRDNSEDNSNGLALVTNRKPKRKYRKYSDEDKATALTALVANEGKVRLTSKQLDIHRTLVDWSKGRNQNPSVVELHTVKKGALADKLEHLVHLVADTMPEKIAKATLSQPSVAIGILIDKVRILRGMGTDPDPAAELCRLLGLNHKQLPTSLDLSGFPPEDLQLPEGELLGIIEDEEPAESRESGPNLDTTATRLTQT